jgi:hypothetical protein
VCPRLGLAGDRANILWALPIHLPCSVQTLDRLTVAAGQGWPVTKAEVMAVCTRKRETDTHLWTPEVAGHFRTLLTSLRQ